MRWPDREPYDGAFHDLFPSWEHFWSHPPDSDEPEVAAPAPPTPTDPVPKPPPPPSPKPDTGLPDGFFEAQLALIAERIESYGNWTRRSASNTITGIGLRNDRLEAAARETAARMGHVEFDPGQTSCVMPDPIEYLEKTNAYRARQAERRAARAKR